VCELCSGSCRQAGCGVTSHVYRPSRKPRNAPGGIAGLARDTGEEKRIILNIYIGNLPYTTTDAELADLFAAYGPVDKATIVNDRETGRSRGFGFVEMADRAAGERAIEELNAQPYNGRPLTVNEARPRPNTGAPRRGGDNTRRSNRPTADSHDGYVSRGYSSQA